MIKKSQLVTLVLATIIAFSFAEVNAQGTNGF